MAVTESREPAGAHTTLTRPNRVTSRQLCAEAIAKPSEPGRMVSAARSGDQPRPS